MYKEEGAVFLQLGETPAILKDHLEHCIVDAVQTQDFAAIVEAATKG